MPFQDLHGYTVREELRSAYEGAQAAEVTARLQADERAD